jgi:hypothetical protein
MVAFTQSLVTAASLIHGKLGQLTRLEQSMVFGNGSLYCTENLDSRGIQLPEGAATDTAHHHRIHGLSPDGHQRLALAVLVIEIPIPDGGNLSGFRVNDNKSGGGSEMTEYHTIDTRILLGWKSDFHTLSPVVSLISPVNPLSRLSDL